MNQKNKTGQNAQKTTVSQTNIKQFLRQLKLPQPNSHKGENGKLLIIGGSSLFHSASRWSLDIASKFVDMVFYCSVPSNNQLIQQAKQYFWNGIVVARQEVESYAQEADCILIGPGMERHKPNANLNNQSPEFHLDQPPEKEEWHNNTQKITNYLLIKFPDKKWIVDAGALQMADPSLFNKNCLLTPHFQELEILLEKTNLKTTQEKVGDSALMQLSKKLNQATILLKGKTDVIVHEDEVYQVEGGNAGMTKGGTGDVLAGLASGLYCTSPILPSAITASYLNKKAGETLFQKTGPFYNASDLVNTIPELLWQEMKK